MRFLDRQIGIAVPAHPTRKLVGGAGLVATPGGVVAAVPLGEGVYTISLNDAADMPLPIEGVGWVLTTNLDDGSPADVGTRETASGTVIAVLHVFATPQTWTDWFMETKYGGDLDQGFFAYDGNAWQELTDLNGARWPTNYTYADQGRTAEFSGTETIAMATTLTESNGALGAVSVSDSRTGAGFVSPNSLDYYLNTNSQYFEDTAATTPATDEADVVAAWKSVAGEKVQQGTAGKRPVLNLSVTQLGSKPGLLFADDQTTPTVARWLALAGGIGTSLNSGFNAFAQIARNAGLTSNGYTMSVVHATDALRVRQGSNIRNIITRFYGTVALETLDDDVGVQSASWDGTYMSNGWNNREIGSMQVDPSTGPGFTAADDLRVGNYSDAAADDARWIGKLCRPTAGTLTRAQRLSERLALGRDMGLVNDGRGKFELSVSGNSIAAGTGAYNNPWPSQLSATWGTTLYDIYNRSTGGIQTKTLAQDSHNVGEIRPRGSYYTSILYKVDVATSREAIDALTNAGLAPGWTTDQWAGWYIVYATGANNKGYAAVVAGNDANTLTLTSPGMPYTPTVGDTFYLYRPGIVCDTAFAVFHEMRNDLYVNGVTEGPNSTGLSKSSCLVYQRHVCACRARLAWGMRNIGIIMLPDLSTPPYPAYVDDYETIQAWMEEDSEGLWSAFLGFTEMPEMADPNDTTYYLADKLHPTNTGGGVIAAAVQAAIEGLQ